MRYYCHYCVDVAAGTAVSSVGNFGTHNDDVLAVMGFGTIAVDVVIVAVLAAVDSVNQNNFCRIFFILNLNVFLSPMFTYKSPIVIYSLKHCEKIKKSRGSMAFLFKEPLRHAQRRIFILRQMYRIILSKNSGHIIRVFLAIFSLLTAMCYRQKFCNS